MPQVFISYARPDEGVARRVANALKADGFDVWWDAELPAHRAYSEVIEKHLREAAAVVVLWSKAAAQSQWVRAEADFARSEGKLVQAHLDGSLPPMPFNQVQCADLKGWRGSKKQAGWAKLKDSVAALVNGEEPTQWRAEDKPRSWTRRGLQVAAAAGLLLLLGALWLLPRWMSPSDGERPVVAVLPFESLDRRDESLVAGIWEDTRQAIGRNPQLLVLGPNTAQQLAEKGPAASSKAADYLVQASVRSVGDRVRVNTNLVRTEDGAQLWSENFDRRLDDVFALQSEIASEIEGRIRGRLARGGGVRPENIATSGEVYALYSDARAKIRKRQGHHYEDAAKQLEQVVRMDPNFAPGWATLAVIKHFGVHGRERDRRSPESDARRAITLAPNLAAAHAALGFVLGQGPAAQSSLRRALALDPNDIEALNWLANSLDQDQVDEKLRLYSEIVEIEPLWWPAVLNRTNLLFDTGGMGAVEAEVRRLDELGAGQMANMLRMQLMQRQGDLSGVAKLGLSEYANATGEERERIGMTFIQSLYQLGYFNEADRLSPPVSDFIPLIRANDPRLFDVIEKRLKPEQFWTFGFLPIVGARVYLLNNQGPRLAGIYRAAARTPQEFEALVGDQALPDVAPMVALALRSGGDERQARALLALAEQRATQSPAEGGDKEIQLARIYAVQGRKEEAIGLLSSAVRGGWLPPYLPIHTDISLDPPLRELNADPRFEAIRQQLLGHFRKERAEVGPISL